MSGSSSERPGATRAGEDPRRAIAHAGPVLPADLAAPTDPTLTGAVANVMQKLEGREEHRAQLFLVLECARLSGGGARFCLSDVDEVTIGRGRERSARRSRNATGRQLEVRVPDRHMSSRHARIERSGSGYVLRDDGSKNGSLVNGEVIRERRLEDGDILELGHTLFVFRAQVPTPWQTPADVDSEHAKAPRGMFTLLPGYAKDLAALARIAPSAVPVTLLGETGTGKEVLAQAIHALAGRSGALVPVNCGALPAALVEGQLFGHMRGAFSGAVRDEVGFVRSAHLGTLFLDEIGDMPLASQPALLRVLQEREVTPVGSSRSVEVDIRVVSATHCDVVALQATGGFRSDLYARLAGFVHHLPPLVERREDLGVLIADLLRRQRSPGHDGACFTPGAGRALLRHRWPLNVRELEQCISLAIVLAEGGVIDAHHLPASVVDAAPLSSPSEPPSRPIDPSAVDPLRDELVAQLRSHRGNVSEVARAMGKARMQIQRWMKRYGVGPDDFRS